LPSVTSGDPTSKLFDPALCFCLRWPVQVVFFRLNYHHSFFFRLNYHSDFYRSLKSLYVHQMIENHLIDGWNFLICLFVHVDVFSYFELLPSSQHVTCQQSSSFDNMQHIQELASPRLFIQLLLHFALAASDFLQQSIHTKSVTSELILRAVLQCTTTLTMTFLTMNAFNEMNVTVELYQHKQTALILRCMNASINTIRNYKSKKKKWWVRSSSTFLYDMHWVK